MCKEDTEVHHDASHQEVKLDVICKKPTMEITGSSYTLVNLAADKLPLCVEFSRKDLFVAMGAMSTRLLVMIQLSSQTISYRLCFPLILDQEKWIEGLDIRTA